MLVWLEDRILHAIKAEWAERSDTQKR